MVVVNVGSEGKEHFHRPLRIGPNLSRLRRIPLAPPLFYFELRSFLAIVIQVLFSSWCWGSSRGRVGDGFGMCLIMVRHLVSVFAYCRLSLPLATPAEHCAHSKFPSGSAIRVLRFWSRNTATGRHDGKLCQTRSPAIYVCTVQGTVIYPSQGPMLLVMHWSVLWLGEYAFFNFALSFSNVSSTVPLLSLPAFTSWRTNQPPFIQNSKYGSKPVPL